MHTGNNRAWPLEPRAALGARSLVPILGRIPLYRPNLANEILGWAHRAYTYPKQTWPNTHLPRKPPPALVKPSQTSFGSALTETTPPLRRR